MKKIFIFFMAVLLFLFLPVLKVNGMTIPNVSEVKFYNLNWYEIPGGPSDTQYYNLGVELEPDIFEDINTIISYEYDLLKLYGVIIFQYPRGLTYSTETYITFKEFYNSQPMIFYYVEFIALKKMSNRLELHIKGNQMEYIFYYYEGESRIEGFRMVYIEPDYSYENGYYDGYNDGHNYGRLEGYQEGYYTGFGDGRLEGHQEGYEWGYEQGDAAGYERGIQEEIETGGFGLLLKQTFIGIGSFLGIELLPNITIGAIIAVPIVFGLIAFILGRKRE